MDKKTYLCLVITYFIEASAQNASVTNPCELKNEGQCYFTVNCEDPNLVETIPHCDYTDPYVTLFISNSTALNITTNFFKTKFDSWVRMIIAVENSWIAVQHFTFSNFKNVMYMDLSRNHIKNIGSAFRGLELMDSLNLSRNHLEVIKPDIFMISEKKNRLHLLDVSYNLLTYLPKEIFVNLENLRKLYLQGNKITTLQEEHSRYMKNLNYLNLCCSNLKMLNMTMIFFLHLRELNLSFNKLKTFDTSVLISLESINLSHNYIEEFNFQTSPGLLGIDLSFNKLKSIYCSNIFYRVHYEYEEQRLTEIKLNNNNLSFIDRNFFLLFKKIRELDLSYNEFTDFYPGMFSYVEVLEVLNVSNNRLQITKQSFKGLDSTITIDLTRNNLSSLDATVFTPCKKLRKIAADYNQITSEDTKKNIYLTVPTLTKFSLKGNPNIEEAIELHELLNEAEDLLNDIIDSILFMIILVGIMILLLYCIVHRKVIFVFTLQCGRRVLPKVISDVY